MRGFMVTGDGKGSGLKIWAGADGAYTDAVATVSFSSRTTGETRRALTAAMAKAIAAANAPEIAKKPNRHARKNTPKADAQ